MCLGAVLAVSYLRLIGDSICSLRQCCGRHGAGRGLPSGRVRGSGTGGGWYMKLTLRGASSRDFWNCLSALLGALAVWCAEETPALFASLGM